MKQLIDRGPKAGNTGAHPQAVYIVLVQPHLVDPQTGSDSKLAGAVE